MRTGLVSVIGKDLEWGDGRQFDQEPAFSSLSNVLQLATVGANNGARNIQPEAGGSGAVLKGLKELELFGLIAKDGPPVQQVQAWRITRADVDDIPVMPKKPETLRRKPELTPCLKCDQPAVVSRRTGWCRTCAKEARIWNVSREIAREEIALDKAAW